MFRILCDPSSGSTELCLTGITRSDSQIFCRVLGRCLATYVHKVYCHFTYLSARNVVLVADSWKHKSAKLECHRVHPKFYDNGWNALKMKCETRGQKGDTVC
jgi:hypothetical protein